MPKNPWEENYEKPGIGEQALEMGSDFLRGVGSGVFSTARGALNLLHQAGRHPGSFQSEYLNQLATPPESTAGQVGHFAEQGTEFLLPGGLVSKGAGALSGLSRAAQIAGRAGLEGLAGAGVAGVQSGGDPVQTATGFLGGTVAGTAGELAPWAASRLKEAAVTQYGRALAPSMKENKAIAKKIIPEAIARGEKAGSLQKLMSRAENRQDFFGKRIDDIWTQMEQQGYTAQVDPILNRLGDYARNEFHIQDATGHYVPIEGAMEAGMAELQKIANTIQNAATLNPINGTREIPIRALRELRQAWDKVARQSKAFTKNQADLPTWNRGRVNQQAGDAVREIVGQARPDLAALNKEYSYWRNLGDVTEDTLERRVGQQVPLYREMAKMAAVGAGPGLAGLMHGGVTEGAVLAALGAGGMSLWKNVTSSPGWNMVSAVTKDRLSQAIANGNRGPAMFYLKQAARAAGLEGATRLGVSAEDDMPAPSGVPDAAKIEQLMRGRPMLPTGG